jgi:two-component system NtrC family sensor kinase
LPGFFIVPDIHDITHRTTEHRTEGSPSADQFTRLKTGLVDAVLTGGRIGIAARREDDGWVGVTIADDGCGIPVDFCEGVFAPFFTTKLSRKNTGLGLSICRNILEEQGGTIGFDTRGVTPPGC